MKRWRPIALILVAARPLRSSTSSLTASTSAVVPTFARVTASSSKLLHQGQRLISTFSTRTKIANIYIGMLVVGLKANFVGLGLGNVNTPSYTPSW